MSAPFIPSNDPEATALAIAYLLVPPISSTSPAERAKQVGELARTMLAAVRAEAPQAAAASDSDNHNHNHSHNHSDDGDPRPCGASPRTGAGGAVRP